MRTAFQKLAVTAVLGLALTGCTSDGGSSTSASSAAGASGAASGSTGSSTSAAPSVSTSGPGASAVLKAAGSGTVAVTSAKVGSAYDAASVDSDKVTVWHSTDAATWTRTASVTRPATAESDRVALAAVVPSGATHALFTLTGPFADDGSRRAMLIGTTGSSWSALSPSGSTLTAASADTTSSFTAVNVVSGQLQTSSTWGDSKAPIKLLTAHPLVTTWKASGASYNKVSTNVVTATTAPMIQPPTTSSVPSDHEGTFVVRINEVRADGRLNVQPVKAVTCSDPDSVGCFDPVGQPFVVALADNARTTFVSTESMVNVVAPPWLWAQINGKRTVVLDPAMFTTGAPYVIPSGLAASIDGVDTAQVTVSGGKIVKADSIFHP